MHVHDSTNTNSVLIAFFKFQMIIPKLGDCGERGFTGLVMLYADNQRFEFKDSNSGYFPGRDQLKKVLTK